MVEIQNINDHEYAFDQWATDLIQKVALEQKDDIGKIGAKLERPISIVSLFDGS